MSSIPDTTLDKPEWAAGGLMSDFVNGLISIKPLFAAMKVAARKTLIDTAEKKGVPWRGLASALEKDSVLKSYFNQVQSKAVTSYPSYYTQEFHAYDEGNLNWMAAYECESAALAMALRVWPKEDLSAEEAQDRLRSSILDAVEEYIKAGKKSAAPASSQFSLPFQFNFGSNNMKSTGSGAGSVKKVIDVGCSIGMSTFYIAERFPEATKVDGLDLSPHFLAVAKRRQDIATSPSEPENPVFSSARRFKDAGVSRIRWLHGYAESTGLRADEYDLTMANFMFHELPQQPSSEIIKEMYRITKPGGTVTIADNNPRSAVIQGLPPVLFTLMKSTVRAVMYSNLQ